jgi:ABC-type glycerol-3-phosphate transport system substrate-binding protein
MKLLSLALLLLLALVACGGQEKSSEASWDSALWDVAVWR